MPNRDDTNGKKKLSTFRLYYAYVCWLFNDFLSSGLAAEAKPEILHRVRIINAMAALATVFLLAFSLLDGIAGRLTSSIILVSSAVAMIAAIVYLRVSKNLRIAALLTCGAVCVACLIRLHYAPPENFGFLWSFMIPLLAVFTLGTRIGGVASLAYIATAMVALYLPKNPLMSAEYAPGFGLRFLATLIGIFATASYVEFARIRATRALHSTDHRFQSLIENSASVYAIIGLDGTVLYESPSLKGVYGYDPEELVGTSILTQVHPDDQKTAQKEIAKLVQNPGRVTTVETRYRHRDGSWRDIEVSGVSLLHDPDVGGIVLTSHDITERKRAEREIREVNETLEKRIRERTEALRRSEERLRQSEKMEAIGQLAGGIAHDFNNQLTAILSCLEMLRTSTEDETQSFSALDAMDTAARRAADLTSQLLAFARKSSGLTAPVDLRIIVREVIALLEHSIDKRIEIREELADGVHVVIGDSAQLHSALLNLAINGRDAMPNGGKICFSSRFLAVAPSTGDVDTIDLEPGKYVVLSVSDTGEGMNEAVLARIFEPFFTTKPVGEGTGMGLAAVYGTAKHHRGTVTVESEPGRGTDFSLYLPLAPEMNVEVRSSTPSPLYNEGQGLRIMVVDDEAVVRETVVMALEKMGHHIIASCEDGEAAIEAYRRSWNETDAVVLDMMMPGLNGRQTFLALKQINSDVRVLLASGYSVDQEAEAALQAGAIDFLQKPFRMRELSRRLVAAAKAEPPTS